MNKTGINGFILKGINNRCAIFLKRNNFLYSDDEFQSSESQPVRYEAQTLGETTKSQRSLRVLLFLLGYLFYCVNFPINGAQMMHNAMTCCGQLYSFYGDRVTVYSHQVLVRGQQLPDLPPTAS